jgi:hypothetical protein
MNTFTNLLDKPHISGVESMTTEQNINAASTQDTAAQPAQHTPTEAANSGSSQSATIPQTKANELIGQAREEGRLSALKQLFEKMGVASEKDLQALKTKAQELEQSKMTESEKLQAEREKAIKERDDAIAERDRERTERRNDKIAAALSTAASKLQAKDAEDVVSHAQSKHAEEFNALIDEAGAVSKEKLDALLEKIKVAKPHYFGDGKTVVQATVIPSNANGRIGNGEADALKRASLNNQRIIRG